MALDTRHVHLLSPLDADQLMLQRAHVVEELGRPFSIDLDLLSPEADLKIADLIGDTMTVALALPDGDRYWHGHVAGFSQGGAQGRYTRYTCTLRPFLWLLTRASDSRIYKQSTVPDIVKHVIAQFGLGEVEDKLQGSYPSREYTVQYRETFFDFLSRMMEEEGIYYYFRHEKQRHVLVLCDDRASHPPAPKYDSVPFIDPAVNAAPREEHFSQWTLRQELESGAYVVNDFDFETPRADLLARRSRPLPTKHAALEQYDPVAGFVESLDAGNNGDIHRGDRGELFARVRLEELQAEFERGVGKGNPRGLFAGGLFELTGHPRSDQNVEQLVVRAEYALYQPGFDAGSREQGSGRPPSGAGRPPVDDEPMVDATITAQPSKTPFRPRRTTARPFIPGPHAATVVGSGEIWTDKHGRVKVHFPWDREDTEGCWVRVGQVWAGGGWGGLQVPRVGQEVIVQFIEGDPDRPIVTGRVYNGSNASPFGLPGGATISGILTRSTPGGTADNANELRFQDQKGAEQLLLHAERNMDTEVEKDQTLWVGQDRRNTIDRDQFEEVKRNKTIRVHGAHDEKIDKDMRLEVVKSESETIGGSRSIDVAGGHTENIGKSQGVTVKGDAAWSAGGQGSIAFGKDGSMTIGGKGNIAVTGNLAISTNANMTQSSKDHFAVDAGKEMSLTVGEAMSHKVTKDYTIAVDGKMKITVKETHGTEAKEILIEGKDKVTLKSGNATIVLDGGSGDVVINGAKISVKGSGDVTVKGSKVAQN